MEKDKLRNSNWKDAINNPPKESGMYLGRVGKTFSEYIINWRADRRLYEIWGLGREFPVTDMKVVLWHEIPTLGKCVECNKNDATIDYNDHLHLVCGPCYETLEKEFEEEYR